FPELAAELRRRLKSDATLSSDALRALEAACDAAEVRAASVATRKASQDTLHIIAPAMPELLGGSADLTGSNLTDWKGNRPLKGDGTGNHVH
ncbi:transketolase, partial [Acinetobacter baumannii]